MIGGTRRRLAVLAAGATILPTLGCGPSKPRPAANAGPTVLTAPRVTAGELDAKALLTDLPARATKLGAGPLSIVTAGEAFEGERMGAFVDVPADVCLLGYARASTSIEDLDVAIFSDEGTPLAVDEAPDAHPTLLLCPPHPDRVYVATHAATGEGLIALGVQMVPRDRATAVGRAVGARGSAGEGPRPADAWPGLDDQARAHRAALGGTWEEFRKVALSVDARAPTLVTFPLEPDRCTDAVVVPGEEIALLEVEALDAEGRVLARAREGGRTRTLTVCSPLGIAGTLSIRPHVGRGLAAVVLSRARSEVARDLTSRPDVAWAAPAVSRDAAVQALGAELTKQGYAGAKTIAADTLMLGRRSSFALDTRTLGAGECLRVDVVAGAPLALIQGAIWDDAGALVATGEGSSQLTVFACSRGQLRIDLETRGRPGPFSVQGRVERWKDPVFSTQPLAAARMLSRAAHGPTMVLEGAPLSARGTALTAAKLDAWSETVAAGKCLRVAAGAQGDGAGLDLRVFDQTGAEIDRSHGSHAASVRACAPAQGSRTFRIEIRATAGRLDAIVGQRVSG